jgi:subtilase family serine protease
MTRLDRKRTPNRRRSFKVEALEERQLLSTTKLGYEALAGARSELKALRVAHEQALVHHDMATAKLTAHEYASFKKEVATAAARFRTAPAVTKLPSPFLSTDIVKDKKQFVVRNGQITAFAPPIGVISPSQMQTAYGLNQLPVTNEGQGTTIAIVDELVDPTIASDVAAFSTQYGLPQLNGVGGNGTFTTMEDGSGIPDSPAGDTSVETALDVEWAHAMAPLANILLVFVPATGSLVNEFDQLLHGVVLAASQPGVSVVSTSYGYYTNGLFNGTNFTGGFTTAQEQTLDSTYLAPGATAASTVALTFSSGDYTLPLYPAVSPNVIAVGGTSLFPASAKGRYGYELPWGGISGDGSAGGGLGVAFPEPTFQSNAGLTFADRAIPDVSMDADPITGVAVYSQNDASANGGDPWFGVGGTSLASPLFAGVIARGQQLRIDASKPILTSVQINNALYSAYMNNYSTYFHDIIAGNNNGVAPTDFGNTVSVTGFNATTGYDLASGIGSPIANQIVALLAAQ